MVELAIFGPFALLALAFMIQLGLRMNYQQEIEQQTFRHALRIAKKEGKNESPSVTMHQFRDRELPDLSSGFSFLPRVSTNASATVTWAEHLTRLEEGDPDSEPRIIVRLAKRTSPIAAAKNHDFELRSGQLKENQPLIKKINKTTTSTGHLTQSSVSGAVSTDVTDTTEMLLNTKNSSDGHLQTTVKSHPVRRNW